MYIFISLLPRKNEHLHFFAHFPCVRMNIYIFLAHISGVRMYIYIFRLTPKYENELFSHLPANQPDSPASKSTENLG